MKPVCEVIVQFLLPSLRVILTKELIEIHGMTQAEAAKKLGVTQPAISHYQKEIRGQNVKTLTSSFPEVIDSIKKLAQEIVEENAGTYEITIKFCEICSAARKRGFICKMHRNILPLPEQCDICFD